MTGEQMLIASDKLKPDVEKVLKDEGIQYSDLKIFVRSKKSISVYVTIDNVMNIVRTRRCIRTLQDPNKPSWYIQVALTPDRLDS